MKILITGSSGLIGRYLIKKLKSLNDLEIGVLSRHKVSKQRVDGVKEYFWDIANGYIDEKAFLDVDVVVNLAGENIFNGWWTPAKKKRIYTSRIDGTRLIVNYIKASQKKTIRLISASAIGIYGDQQDLMIKEDSSKGNGFLASLCQEWEREAFVHQHTQILRIGVVLAKDGGALGQLTPWFRYNLGIVIGTGKQFFSFIHIDDLIEIILFLIKHPHDQKIYNATSPNPITNWEFSKALADVLNVRIAGSVPEKLLKFVLGEKGQIVLQSQRVIPDQLLSYGFKYKHPDILSCLNDLI